MKKAKAIIYILSTVFLAAMSTILQMGGTTVSDLNGLTVNNRVAILILGAVLVGLPLVAMAAANLELHKKRARA